MSQFAKRAHFKDFSRYPFAVGNEFQAIKAIVNCIYHISQPIRRTFSP